MKLGIRTLLLTQILESYLLKRKEEINKKILHHTPISFALKEYDIHSHHLVLNTQEGRPTNRLRTSLRSESPVGLQATTPDPDKACAKVQTLTRCSEVVTQDL